MRNKLSVVLAGGALLAALSGTAAANGHVGFSVSVGGPGYAFSYGPAPVYVAPPPVYYAPAEAYYAPPPPGPPSPARPGERRGRGGRVRSSRAPRPPPPPPRCCFSHRAERV